MSQKLDWTISAKDQGVLNTLSNIDKSLNKINRDMDRVGQSGRRASSATKSGFSQATASVKQFIGTFAGVGGVMAGIRAIVSVIQSQIQDIRAQQDRSLNKQREFAPAFAQAFRNTGGFFTPEKFDKRFNKLSKELPSADPTELANALGGSFSAVGVTNKREAEIAFNATRAAFRFAPLQDGETKQRLASVGGSLAKRFNITPAQAIGLIQSTGNLSNINSLTPLVQNIGPALLGLGDAGFKKRESASLLAALTQGIGDDTGQTSRTAATKLTQELTRFRKQTGRGKSESIGDTLRAIQDDPKLRKLFIEGGKTTVGGKAVKIGALPPGEAKSFFAVQSLLGGGDGAVANQFRAGVPMVGDDAKQQRVFDDNVRLSLRLKKTQAARVDKLFSGIVANQQINDNVGAQSAAVRQGIRKFLLDRGFGTKDVDFITTKLDLINGGRLDLSTAINLLEQRAATAQSNVKMMRESGFDKMTGSERYQNRSLENAKAQLILAQQLRDLQGAMQDNTRAQRGSGRSKVPSSKLNRNN